jgi:ethanolamine ammonia-lyase small subunit
VTDTDDITAAWARLAELTPARIALGRTGIGLPTREVLGFAMAHARARDAVHTALGTDALAGELEGLGLDVARVTSAVTSREVYLRRPDLGRRLDEASAAAADALTPKDADLAMVVGDGLSATAVHRTAAAASPRWWWQPARVWPSATTSANGCGRERCWCSSASGPVSRPRTASAPI